MSQLKTTHLLGVGCMLKGILARHDLFLSPPKGPSRDCGILLWNVLEAEFRGQVNQLNCHSKIKERIRAYKIMRIKIQNPASGDKFIPLPSSQANAILAQPPLPSEITCFSPRLGIALIAKGNLTVSSFQDRGLQTRCGSFRCSLGETARTSALMGRPFPTVW